MPNEVEDILARGATARLHPQGSSMWPTLREGDVVELAPVGTGRVSAHDIVLYRRERGPLVLHRVVRSEGEYLWLRGDNQFEVEGPLPSSCVRGILVARERNGRRTSACSLTWRAWGLVWTAALPLRRLVRALRGTGT